MGLAVVHQQPADHGAALQLQIPPQPLQLVPFSGSWACYQHLGITTARDNQITAAEHGASRSRLEGLGNRLGLVRGQANRH